MDEPVTHLMDPFTGKPACKSTNENDYLEKDIPEFVDCKACVDWYYQDYLKVRKP